MSSAMTEVCPYCALNRAKRWLISNDEKRLHAYVKTSEKYGGKLHIIGGDEIVDVPINNCPMCGREL